MTHHMIDRQSLGLTVRRERLMVLDQTLLPGRESWIEIEHPSTMVLVIQQLRVRGAPLIGVAAALCLALHARRDANCQTLIAEAEKLRHARPTAVNLMNCIDRLLPVLRAANFEVETVVQLAEAIFDEDVKLCNQMGDNGERLINDGDGVLTHCNTGGLATVGIGTALGVIRRAHERGKRLHVFVDETRPLLQGARLTTWELRKLGIPFTLICDNMAAMLMGRGKIQKIFVGADRIAANGDVANKVGTYSVAVNAHHHQIPFYVVAPHTTLDPKTATGEAIPIEERAPQEVLGNLYMREKTPEVFNPAFDVTPAALITNIVLDRGVFAAAEVLQALPT